MHMKKQDASYDFFSNFLSCGKCLHDVLSLEQRKFFLIANNPLLIDPLPVVILGIANPDRPVCADYEATATAVPVCDRFLAVQPR
jgi:hypothetical protein